MNYLYAFLFCGSICLIGELILDNTKLTPGHITSIFVVVGACLSFLGIYPKLNEIFGIVSSLPITSFGNLLYQACLEGYNTKGVLGMFTNLFSTTSLGIGSAIIFAFLITLFCKPKD